MQNNMLNESLKYLTEGLSVIPIRGPHYALGNTKEDRSKSSKSTLISWAQYQKRLPTVEEVKQWFSRWPNANIACITGEISGLVVVDFDSPKAVERAHQLRILNTPTVKTSRGIHAYYKYPLGKKIRNIANEKTKVDIRGEGGIIIMPPSLHMSGHRYEWVLTKRLGSIPLMELPDMFLDEVRSERPTGHSNLKPLYRGVQQGGRNHALARLCGSWINDGLTLDECLQMAMAWNVNNEPTMGISEIETIINSIMRYKKSMSNPEKHVFYSGYSIFSMPLCTFSGNDNGGKTTYRYKTSNSQAERVWLVTNSEKYGVCSSFDDAVFMAINKIVLGMPSPLKNPVDIGSFDNITKLIKIEKPTTEDYRAIRTSIKKLASLLITSLYTNKKTESKDHIESNFRIFDKVVFKAEVPDGKNSIYSNYVWLSDTYLKCINNGYLPHVDLDEYLSIEEGIARALYKLLLIHFQSGNNIYKTSYMKLQEYLGLASNDAARIQLTKAHAELKKKRIVDDILWENGAVTYVKTKKSHSITEEPCQKAAAG